VTNMQSNQSNQSVWNWIVPLILALILLWMLMTGRGPSSACCTSPAEPAVAAEAIAPVEESAPVTEAFNFSASANEFTSSGDKANISWVAQSDTLKGMLSGDLKAEGDDKSVVLTGIVDSEASKQQKGSDAQAFFGSGVTIDNQLMVKAAEVAVMPPPAAKLYFESGKTSLPSDADADATLSPIIAWLNANSSAKTVLSGYHDSTGNHAYNQELAKNRAKIVRDTLKAAGIDESRIEMRKPESVDGGADLAEARRVEVSVE
jgi:outer membrane protein OmpA-like peptidoglycan-associated protein